MQIKERKWITVGQWCRWTHLTACAWRMEMIHPLSFCAWSFPWPPGKFNTSLARLFSVWAHILDIRGKCSEEAFMFISSVALSLWAGSINTESCNRQCCGTCNEQTASWPWEMVQSFQPDFRAMHWSSSPPLVFTWRSENNSHSFQLYNSDEMSVADDNPPWFLFQSLLCLLSLSQCVSGDYSKLCFTALRPENCQMMIPSVISQNAVLVHLTLLWMPKG